MTTPCSERDLGPVDALARVLGGHALEIVDERLLTLGDHRVVLRVAVADVPLYRLSRTALVEHQLVEGNGVALVLHRRWAHLENLCDV